MPVIYVVNVFTQYHTLLAGYGGAFPDPLFPFMPASRKTKKGSHLLPQLFSASRRIVMFNSFGQLNEEAELRQAVWNPAYPRSLKKSRSFTCLGIIYL